MNKTVELKGSVMESISQKAIEAAKIFNPNAKICIVYRQFTPRDQEDYDNLYIFKDESLKKDQQLEGMTLVLVSQARQNLDDITNNKNFGVVLNEEENFGRLAIVVRARHQAQETASIAFSEFNIPFQEYKNSIGN